MVDTADLKSAGQQCPWGFESPRRYFHKSKVGRSRSKFSPEGREKIPGTRCRGPGYLSL